MFSSSNHRDNVVGKMISSYLSNQSQFDDHTIHLLFSANRWEKRHVICRSLILLGYFGYTMRLLLRLSPNPRKYPPSTVKCLYRKKTHLMYDSITNLSIPATSNSNDFGKKKTERLYLISCLFFRYKEMS
ncbi:putative dTMP kinase [Helianthus annuus]|nr:putative dTMP kinase [Helianthus annuus]KAJ0575209.1 putative dTMP kinase [Helianthus annuus]KAJ0583163.1 putative dTMP kinase [Helianthus annuus]KAJ0745901.1 putative dTMP kinase [Helianthus annuus]KAJ0748885.1 putative dTMP kinase [Helianthus annuus]